MLTGLQVVGDTLSCSSNGAAQRRWRRMLEADVKRFDGTGRMRRSLIATGLVGGMAVAGMSFGPLAGTAGAAAITGIPTSSDYSPVNPVGSFT